MNFDFIPYKLNQGVDYFESQIRHISTDNGVELYKLIDISQSHILSLPLKDVNLYFLWGALITIYCHLDPGAVNTAKVLETLEEAIGGKASRLELPAGWLHIWVTEQEVLGLVSNKTGNRSYYLYFTLREYSVFS